ncbi:MORN repeat-containing protein [Massilia sp. 9I]|uniref:MORN repeat-containing protein n=1 Tax=Massilia sp. 9I TaxID=2653152 RepID=UPI0012F13301|nr:hypothetical protein [Massilia sp. 9I]VXC30299.1 conserved exported hypothetical protein [Massilia sp. 9I]
MNVRARLLFLPLLLVNPAAHAADLGKADCRIAQLLPAPVDGAVSWSGGCKDGYAEGKGVLEWRTQSSGKRRLEASLVQGVVMGEATVMSDAGTYIGPVRWGMPHGSGYLESARDGSRYEGDFVDGRKEGNGVQEALDRSSYEGQWKKNRRHGIGKASYTLGGSYEGEWRDGQMHGQGKIVYNGGRSYTGEFVDGRALDAAPRPVGERERFALKDEHPAVGSFLKRDRAIGSTPMEASWQELTPAQQAMIRSAYPALDDRDEPPYPLKGGRAWYGDVAKLYRKFTDYRGDALVYVTVGADGKPTSVSTYGVPHKEFARYLGMVAMIQRFKPALCAGTPCEMLYPIKFRFTVEQS